MKTGRKMRMSELSPCLCLDLWPSAARQNGLLLHLLCFKLSVKSSDTLTELLLSKSTCAGIRNRGICRLRREVAGWQDVG